MSLLLVWSALLVGNLALAYTVRSDIYAGDDSLWSSDVDGAPSLSMKKILPGSQGLMEVLLATEVNRLSRRQRRRRQQETAYSSPDGATDRITKDDSSLEATPTGQHQRPQMTSSLRRLRDQSLPLTSTTDERGISTDDLYRHLSKYSRNGVGERTRKAEDLKRRETRKRPTKTTELDPTFMLMGIGRK